MSRDGVAIVRSAGCKDVAESASDAAAVQRVDDQTKERLLMIRGWRGFNNPWVAVDASDVDYSYINLQQNAERYTGYKVLSASHSPQTCSCSRPLFAQ